MICGSMMLQRGKRELVQRPVPQPMSLRRHGEPVLFRQHGTAARWPRWPTGRIMPLLPLAQHYRQAAVALAAALVLVPSFAIRAASAQQQGADWGRYRDRDLRVSFDFPRHIFPLQSAVQGGPGVTFSTSDGRARIRVFAAHNEGHDTPARYLARIRNDGEGRFTYVRTTGKFFVASGVHDGAIF